jgi:hypothetical protein
MSGEAVGAESGIEKTSPHLGIVLPLLLLCTERVKPVMREGVRDDGLSIECTHSTTVVGNGAPFHTAS